MAETIEKAELLESRFADTKGLNGPGRYSQLSIAKAVSTDRASRAWRVTLSRLNRQDSNALLTPSDGVSSPNFVVADFSYTTGFQTAAHAIPPRRSNPVFGKNVPANNADIDPPFVQISFGMNQGQNNRILADWPYQGASIVVEGAYVEVFAGVFFGNRGDVGSNQVTDGEAPVFAAQIVPVDGLASHDAGELSITQRQQVFTVSGGDGSGESALRTDGTVTIAPSGFTASTGPNSAIPTSAVFNVAPFSGWDAIVKSRIPVSRQVGVFVSNVGGPVFALQDNALPDAAGNFVPSPGNVGIVYRTNGAVGAKTVAELETLVNSSGLINVTTPSPNPGFFVFPGWTANGATHAPAGSGLGLGLIAGLTQGAVFYVPDYARRVRVTLAHLVPEFLGNELRVPETGTIITQLVWYDDFGNVVDVGFSGPVQTGAPDVPGPYAIEPIAWHPVPASAVMLAVYSPDPDANALVHWRVAP